MCVYVPLVADVCAERNCSREEKRHGFRVQHAYFDAGSSTRLALLPLQEEIQFGLFQLSQQTLGEAHAGSYPLRSTAISPRGSLEITRRCSILAPSRAGRRTSPQPSLSLQPVSNIVIHMAGQEQVYIQLVTEPRYIGTQCKTLLKYNSNAIKSQ